MEQYKHVLTGDAVPTAKRRVRRFLLGYLWLSLDAFCKKSRRYKLRPKQLSCTYCCLLYINLQHNRDAQGSRLNRPRLHTWWHVFTDLQLLPLNPRINSCFGDEDFVRRLCSIDSWLIYQRGCSTISIECCYRSAIDPRHPGAMQALCMCKLRSGTWLQLCLTGSRSSDVQRRAGENDHGNAGGHPVILSNPSPHKS